VIGLPDDDLGNAPDAIVAISSEVDADELAAQLRARLASDKPPPDRSNGWWAPLRDDAGEARWPALSAARLAGPAHRAGFEVPARVRLPGLGLPVTADREGIAWTLSARSFRRNE